MKLTGASESKFLLTMTRGYMWHTHIHDHKLTHSRPPLRLLHRVSKPHGGDPCRNFNGPLVWAVSFPSTMIFKNIHMWSGCLIHEVFTFNFCVMPVKDLFQYCQKSQVYSQMWRRLRQENFPVLETSPGYVMRLCLKENNFQQVLGRE